MNSISEEVQEDLELRLKRIEGQVRGLHRMLEKEKYCVDILTQVVAVRGALKKVGLKILDQHINGCVQRALTEDDGEEIIEELMDVLEKFTE